MKCLNGAFHAALNNYLDRIQYIIYGEQDKSSPNMIVYFRLRRMSIDSRTLLHFFMPFHRPQKVVSSFSAPHMAVPTANSSTRVRRKIKIAHEFKVFADTRTSLNAYDRVLRKFVMFFLQSSLKSCEWTT